jgi:hypothetical protein
MRDEEKLRVLSKMLMQAVASGAGIQNLLDLSANLLGNPLAVGRTDFEVLYVTKNMPPDSINAPPRRVMRKSDERSILLGMDIVFPCDDPIPFVAIPDIMRYETVMAQIKHENEVTGYLAFVLPDRSSRPPDLAAADLIRNAIELSLQIVPDPHMIPVAYRELLLSALFYGNHDSDYPMDHSIVRKKLGIRQLPLRVFVCGYRERYHANAPTKTMRERLAQLLDSELFCIKPGELTILTSVDIFTIREAVENALREHRLIAGVSYPYSSLDKTHLHYRQARFCRNSIPDDTADRTPLSFYSTAAADDLFQITEADFSGLSPAANKLFNYDKEKGTELCRTMLSFYSNRLNMQNTAIDLRIHINTVYQRIDRAEKLLSEYGFCRDSLFLFKASLSAMTRK